MSDGTFCRSSEKQYTFANLLQDEKADPPILVTEFGMVTDVKPLQPKKEASPILVTEFGMVTDVKPVQQEKV